MFQDIFFRLRNKFCVYYFFADFLFCFGPIFFSLPNLIVFFSRFTILLRLEIVVFCPGHLNALVRLNNKYVYE